MKDLAKELIRLANKLAAIGAEDEAMDAAIHQMIDPKMRQLRERMRASEPVKTKEDLEDSVFVVQLTSAPWYAGDKEPDYDMAEVSEKTLSYGELYDLVGEYQNLSSSVIGSRTWVSRQSRDYRTGVRTEESLHIKSIDGKEPTARDMEQIFGPASQWRKKT